MNRPRRSISLFVGGLVAVVAVTYFSRVSDGSPRSHSATVDKPPLERPGEEPGEKPHAPEVANPPREAPNEAFLRLQSKAHRVPSGRGDGPRTVVPVANPNR